MAWPCQIDILLHTRTHQHTHIFRCSSWLAGTAVSAILLGQDGYQYVKFLIARFIIFGLIWRTVGVGVIIIARAAFLLLIVVARCAEYSKAPHVCRCVVFFTVSVFPFNWAKITKLHSKRALMYRCTHDMARLRQCDHAGVKLHAAHPFCHGELSSRLWSFADKISAAI